MPLDPKYLGAIKGYEGYTPRATWDYRQNSNGYGTKAKYAGEVIDKDEAERRFQYEIALARDQVRALGIPMSPGQEAALTSLTYNAGSGWINSGLGAAVKSGDWGDAAKRFVQYNKAGGETLPGLVNRRSGEASWLTDATPVSQDAEAQRGGFYGEPTPPAETSVASATPSSAPSTAKPSWSDDLASFGKSAETALRLAKPKQQEGDGLDPIQFVAPAQLRPVKMAEAPVPYMTRAEGGAIDDTGSNVPEDVNALRAQQRQLIEGRRSAQMFPQGTEELPLPPFMERIETARGIYHFDPMKVSADEIMEASRTGRENDILGLGPLSKNDVARLAGETGESPVAITERDQSGNEVKASMATPSTVAMQSDEILRSAAPGHKVDVEPVGDVVMARDAGDRALGLARADGGEVKPRREPELNQWDPPWYERLPHAATDLIFGENAGPRDGAMMKKLLGPENPMNLPGQVAEGASRIRGGYERGDYGEMAHGALEAAGGIAPAAGAASIAGRMGPSARQTLREQRAWEANTPAGRGQAERAAEAADAASHSTALAARNKAEMRDIERAYDVASQEEKAAMGSILARAKRGERIDVEDLAHVGSVLDNATPTALQTAMKPGHVVSQGAAAGAADKIWDLGIMPWSWNEPGTVQRDVRDKFSQAWKDASAISEFERMSGQSGHPIKWSPPPQPEIDPEPAIERARGGGIGGSGAIVGALTGATGGRADKIPGTARAGSHVLPADVVSHLGQGNSMAGLRTLQQMFKTGPYGTPLPTRRRADGGEVESEIPVMLSDGEFVVPPEMVAELGGGDIAMGHDVLDAWIMDERQKAIQTLSDLPPPATD